MKRPGFILALGMLVGAGPGLLAGQFLRARPEGIKRTMLLETDVAGMEGRESFEPCNGGGFLWASVA